MNRKARWIAAAVVVAAAVAALVTPRMTSEPAPSLERQFERIVADAVARNPLGQELRPVRDDGDGSLVWAGTAGVARQANAAPMTSDTPIYIASVTKLYTATAVLLLQERGSLPLDDPMAKYPPPDLIGGHRKDLHKELSPIVASCVASLAIDPSRGLRPSAE